MPRPDPYSKGIRPGDVFWIPELIWAGRTVIACASGPSFKREAFGLIERAQRVDGAIVFAANCSLHTLRENGVEPDAVYFMDHNWWNDWKKDLVGFQGRLFSSHRTVKIEEGFLGCGSGRIHRTHVDMLEDFPLARHLPGAGPGDQPGTRFGYKHGRSSGHMLVTIGVSLGAARVIMLGFDGQKAADGSTHCHSRYKHRTNDADLAEFVAHYAGWNAAAERVGVDILNATPGSAVREFPMLSLVDALGRRAA